MKHILRQWMAYGFLLVAAVVIFMHFSPAIPQTSGRVELSRRMEENSRLWKEYAPIAQAGKQAERAMSLLEQENNLIREQLRLLVGTQK